MDWIVVLGVLLLSSLLYWDATKRLPVIRGTPLASAEPITDIERGSGPNLMASVSVPDGRWSRERINVKFKTAMSPDGTQSATRLGERFAAGLHRIETVVSGISPGGDYALSLFVRADGCSGIQFEMSDHGEGSYGVARFDLVQEGLIAQIGSVRDAGLQKLPDGWFRAWAVMPYATNRAVINLTLLNAKGEWRYLGNGLSGMFIWGAQLEPGSRVSGYAAEANRS